MSKRLTKTIWYGSGVDSNGNPILPSNNGGLDGLNYGELYLHLSNYKATLWTLSSDGKIVEITGGADVDMSKYLLKSIWDKVFELKTDSQGTDYIFSKLPVVTQYGITMYSGDGVDIPSLASGLPFDGRTIWYNPDTNQIEVIGGTGGGSGEGVSNFWDLSGIPSWITISKPKYTYSEIEGTPDLSVFATQNWIINQGYASAEELKKYIPISGYTEVSGEKNFTGGLKVNGSPIYYDTEKKYWKLEGDLLVTGGVTMYGVDSTDIPSLIKSLPVASTKEKGVAYFDPNFFSVSSDGKVSFIGETGGGLDITALQNYLTQNSYLNVTEGDNRYLKLSGGTMGGDITLPKNSGKSTTYAIDFFEGSHYYLFTEGGVLKYGVTPNVNTIIHSGNYSNYALPLSGGVVKGVTTINGNSKTSAPLEIETPGMGYNGYIKFASSGTTSGYLGMGGIDKPVFRSSAAINYTLWHSGNDGADSGLDADLLDGKHNGELTSINLVRCGSGVLDADTLVNSESLFKYYAGIASSSSNIPTYTGYQNALLEIPLHSNGVTSQFYFSYGKNPYYRAGVDKSWNEIAYKTDNVASATKLQTARKIWGQSFDGSGDVSGSIVMNNDSSIAVKNTSGSVISLFHFTSSNVFYIGYGALTAGYNTYIDGKNIYLRYGASRSNGITLESTGNVGIGTISPSYKLHVVGDIFAGSKVNVNGIEISKSKDDVLYIDGNVVVRGGVTMYGTNSTTTPSLFDSLPIASTKEKGVAYFDSEFFSVGSDGKVSFIGKTDGFNVTELQNYLTQNSYLNTTSGDNRYLKLSGGTMGGDITLTKNSGKSTSYSIDFFDGTHKYLFTDGGVLKYGIGTNMDTIIHSGNYSSYALPLSGGNLNGALVIITSVLTPLTVSSNGMGYKSYIYYQNGTSSGNDMGGLGFSGKNVPSFRTNSTDGMKEYKLIHENNYSSYALPLSGGTMGGDITLTKNSGKTTTYSIDFFDGTHKYLFAEGGVLKYGASSNINTIIHSGNIESYNAGSATKLQTARKIWGQSFDGSGDVSGSIVMNNDSSIAVKNTSGSVISLFHFTSSNVFYIGYGALTAGYNTYIDGKNIYLRYGASRSNGITLESTGNVGIGTISPSYKLHVVGNTYFNGDVFADELNTYDVIPRASATYDLGNSSYKWNNVYASSMIAGYIHGGGSALYLGNSDNSSYIYIREDMKAYSESWSLTTSGTMSLSGDLTSGSYGSNCVAKFQGIGSGTGYYSVVELITNNEVTISYSNSSRYSDSRRWSVGRASSNSNYRFNFWNASYNGAVSYIDLNGNFWVAGGVTMYSDRRKKTILRDVELSLEEVANAPLIEHYYNNDDKKTIHVGSIAQYWAGLNDWFCKLDSEGFYTMEIQNAALASAISVARELDRYESKTDKDIKKLKKRICELEEEVERLKSA